MSVARRRIIPQWLWTLGESGTWLDFSPDYTYTDTAGTAPAGAGDFIANAGDRSPNSADAVQGTSAARSRLSARYNLLTKTEFAGGLADTSPKGGLVSAASISGFDGAIAFGHDGSATSFAYKGFTPISGLVYRLSVYVEMDDAAGPPVVNSEGAAPGTGRDFALTIFSNPVTTGYSVEHVAGSLYRVSVEATGMTATYWGVVKYPNNTSRTFKVTGYDLRLASDTDKPPYQRVGDLSADPGDYDTAGFPYYAALDLTDDVYPVTLPAITGGQIALFGRNGYYIADLTYAGGTFEIGPTTYTGGAAGAVSALGGLLAVAIVDRAFTAAERAALIQWSIARGAQDEDLNP